MVELPTEPLYDPLGDRPAGDLDLLKKNRQKMSKVFQTLTSKTPVGAAVKMFGPDVLQIGRDALSSSKKIMDSLSNDYYQNILNAITKNEGGTKGSLKSALVDLGQEPTEANKVILSKHKREAINRGLTSKLDAATEYTPEYLQEIPIKIIDPSRATKKIFLNSTVDKPNFALIKQEGVLIPNYYHVKPSTTGDGTNINVLKNIKYNKIFADENNLNKFLNYVSEYPDTSIIARKPNLKKNIADDLGYSVGELFGTKGTLRDSVFNKAKIIAQNVPKYDTSPSQIKQFLSNFSVKAKKEGSRISVDNSWKGLSTNEILYYLNNADTLTIQKISENLDVPYSNLNTLKNVVEKAKIENPKVFENIIGKFERKLYEGAEGRTRELLTGSNVKLAPGSKDVMQDIIDAGFKDKMIKVGDKTESLVPAMSKTSPKLHDQGAVMLGTKQNPGNYAMVYDDAMEAQQGFNILFTPTTKRLRASQTSTQSANAQQAVFEKDLIKLMDKRKNLIAEGQAKGFNSTSKITGIVPKDRSKTIFELLKDNERKLGGINQEMENIGVRTLMRVRQPDGTFKIKQFGEVLSGMTDFLKKRQAGLLKNGGRVGFEKGGRVQINPEDYVEHYSDGTKLYKYKSFFRDITKII